MHATCQFEITPTLPAGPAGPAGPQQGALRALLGAARRAAALPGFRRWQTFRALGARDALLVLVDWDSPTELWAALADPGLLRLREHAAALGFHVGPARELTGSFDRQLGEGSAAATLLRVSTAAAPLPGAAARDNHLALQALAAPGTVRAAGARAESGLAVCRLDFDTDDALWHFLQSPLRLRWSAAAEEDRESEAWALNLPRLEYSRTDPPPRRELGMLRQDSRLALQYSVSDDRREACIWLQGRVDARGALWCERLIRGLLAEGCLRLRVDVSGLAAISPEALAMLTGAARELKERAGQFALVDNEARVKRVTRSRHLHASVR